MIKFTFWITITSSGLAFLFSCGAINKVGQTGLAIAQSAAATASGQKITRTSTTEPRYLGHFNLGTQIALINTDLFNVWLGDHPQSFESFQNPDITTILILPYEYFAESAGTATIIQNSPYYKKGKELGARYAILGRVNEIILERRGNSYRTSTTFNLELIDINTDQILNSAYINDSRGIFNPTEPQGMSIGASPWKDTKDGAMVETLNRCHQYIVAFVKQLVK